MTTTTTTTTTTADPRQTAADLRRAARISAERGWTRGAYVTLDGEVCAVGAIRAATPGDLFRTKRAAQAVYPLIQHLFREVQGFKHDATSCLIGYNDRYCSGGDELQLLFIQAAEKLEAEL